MARGRGREWWLERAVGGENRQLAVGRVGVALDQGSGRVAEPDDGVLLVAVIVERSGAAGRERGPRAGVPQERATSALKTNDSLPQF